MSKKCGPRGIIARRFTPPNQELQKSGPWGLIAQGPTSSIQKGKRGKSPGASKKLAPINQTFRFSPKNLQKSGPWGIIAQGPTSSIPKGKRGNCPRASLVTDDEKCRPSSGNERDVSNSPPTFSKVAGSEKEPMKNFEFRVISPSNLGTESVSKRGVTPKNQKTPKKIIKSSEKLTKNT